MKLILRLQHDRITLKEHLNNNNNNKTLVNQNYTKIAIKMKTVSTMEINEQRPNIKLQLH